jgi:hypothetical protein
VRLNPDLLYLNASYRLAIGDEEGCSAELKTLGKAEPTGRYTLRSMLLQARVNMREKEFDKAAGLLDAVLKNTTEEPLIKEATALKTIATEAKQNKTRFTETTRRYWPYNLVADGSFETNAQLPQIELSAAADSYKISLQDQFGSDGKHCLKIELLKPVAPPCYLTVRFPTAVGDRLFARCRILCTDADFRWSEVRRSSTQSDSLYTRFGNASLSLQQWGWLESITNVEPWRQFSWRTAPTTAGETTGAIAFAALARPGKTIIPAGTRIYVDQIECYLAP